MCLFNYHDMKVCWGVEVQLLAAFIPTQKEHVSFREYKFRTKFMSLDWYADTCRHVSQYFTCNFQFGCCDVRLALCVRRRKLEVYAAVFRCQFSRRGSLSI